MITVREFRNNLQRLTETVRVIRARGEVQILGTWTPWETEDDERSEDKSDARDR